MTTEATNTALAPLDRLHRDLAAFVAPVAPRPLPLAAAIGAVIAADLVVDGPVPAAAVALVAGWAVASIETVGASPYAPAMPSRLVAVAAGAEVPPGCDAVLPAEAVTRDFGMPAVQQTVAPGENLRRAGEDLAAGTVLVPAGGRLTHRAAAIAAALGIETVAARRPRVVVTTDSGAIDPMVAAILTGAAVESRSVAEPTATTADLRLVLGGAEIAADDPASRLLSAGGRRLGAGVALRGCESLVWGEIAGRPALVLPSRPEALFVAGLAIVAPLVAALSGATTPPSRATRVLTRKLVSQVGYDEIALLAATDDGGWRPLAVGDPSWRAIVDAEAFALLPPESEGLAEGTPLAAILMSA